MSRPAPTGATAIPSSASAPAQTPPEPAIPETLTGWVRRIRAYCEEHGRHLSVRQTKNLAAKINARAERMQFVDPDDLIRYNLDYADPTGETATERALRCEIALARTAEAMA